MKYPTSRPRSTSSGVRRACLAWCATPLALLLGSAAPAAAQAQTQAPTQAQEVVFEVQGVRPPAAPLIVALFRARSPEWEQRFKRAERADLRCQRKVSGLRPREDVACALEPGEYIALVFSDTDGDGMLSHGLLGPTEAFGLSGVGHAITLPPEPARTIFDTSRASRFVIVLN